MKLPEFCQTLEHKLSSVSDSETKLRLAALALQQAFKVNTDEVAFLRLDPATETLHFIWPEKLRAAGCIPLSTRDSLAAKTITEAKAQKHNRFASIYHASIFEQIPLQHTTSTDSGSTGPQPIQKIMSAPLLCDNQCIGVAQVCRKGIDANQAGPDFTDIETEALGAIAAVIGTQLIDTA